ncbi:MAG: carbon-nitrogen hydrolase family protein [Nitrososphaerota archaeon]|nr:carbon-nitrogen hydrolase family protein [Nitrososphaerota archaeon]
MNAIRGAARARDPVKVTVCEMPDDRLEFDRAWAGLARHVRRESSDLVLLPEMTFYGWFCSAPKFDPMVWKDAVAAHRRWVGRIGEIGAPAVLGSRPVDRGGRRLNEGFVWTKKGTRAVHHKNYLPNEGGFFEASWYDRGDRTFTPFGVSGWKAGYMICSDLWAMGGARSYGKRGVGLIAAPRCTPEASTEKWIAGGKVAAVVSGSYCLSSNRAGSRGGLRFGGRGWAIDPDGRVLGLTSKGRPFVTVEIDQGVARKAKATYPRKSLEPD